MVILENNEKAISDQVAQIILLNKYNQKPLLILLKKNF